MARTSAWPRDSPSGKSISVARGNRGNRAVGKPARVPVRSCAVCRTRRPQNELLRVCFVGEEPRVLDDATIRPSNSRGRSAYVCPERESIEKLFEKGRIERALRRPLDPDRHVALCQALLCKLR
ncbi:MAG: YlxR family protein [Fimbriimonadaceae bacterium]|nr:YlxR family protein [Fimbriimonadaceae bacterium]